MNCDKCQKDFPPAQMFRNDLKLVSGPPNEEYFKSMGVAPLLDQDPPLIVSNWLCKECFQRIYRRKTLKFLTIISIVFGLMGLFVISLLFFGKWDSEAERITASAIGLIVVFGGLVLIWIVSIRRHQSVKPKPADQNAVFDSFYNTSLRALAEELARPKSASSIAPPISAAAIDQQADLFRQLGFKVSGLEEAKAAARRTDEVRSGLADDPTFRSAVNRLLDIYQRHPQGFIQGSGGVSEQQIRNIGQGLDDLGGKELMLAVHADFADHCPFPGAARNLEFMWDGIGSWLG